MKNVLITGGSGDIGSEIVTHLAESNFKVFFTYNKNYNSSKKLFQNLKKKNKKIFFFKVSNKNQNKITDTLKKIKTKHGNIDILINNYGKSQ